MMENKEIGKCISVGINFPCTDEIEEIIKHENEKPNVIIIGSAGHGRTVIEQQIGRMKSFGNVIVVGDNLNRIEIDGKFYQKIIESKHPYDCIINHRFDCEKSEPILDKSINVVEEYRLILKKKCNLSRSNRELVIKEFHKRYKLIDKEQPIVEKIIWETNS